ncbi:MAG: succinylglutamate desuccinylase/aspartoacylase family protein, partial [Deltaproteobacteria bacterium]|nr:succinylglutamate desuccinylase/aspartoacylase family protein [Deltaproteobacteria bacterium]
MPVARLPSGSWIEMPVVVLHGSEPGPTAWLSGAIHGDELNGIEIVRRLLKQIDPKTLCGTVLGVPIVNVYGVTSGSRYLPDRRDLNRSFPGSMKGSMASRVAHLFFDRVASRCDVGLDFHTGSNGRSNLPHLRCDTDNKKTRRLANHFGPPLVIQAGLRDGSLRAAASERGIQVLLYEAGEAHRFDEAAIQLGVDGTLRVLSALKMIPPSATTSGQRPMIAKKSSWM